MWPSLSSSAALSLFSSLQEDSTSTWWTHACTACYCTVPSHSPYCTFCCCGTSPEVTSWDGCLWHSLHGYQRSVSWSVILAGCDSLTPSHFLISSLPHSFLHPLCPSLTHSFIVNSINNPYHKRTVVFLGCPSHSLLCIYPSHWK